MPIASLSRFTVPISGSQAAGSQGLLMPKLKFRFRVTLDSFGVGGTPSTELTKQVMNVSRPDITFEEIKLEDDVSSLYERLKKKENKLYVEVLKDLAKKLDPKG